MQNWLDMITDPDHIIADFIMNVGFEVVFAWVTYLVVMKVVSKQNKGKHRRKK